jgi:hypothetical protein
MFQYGAFQILRPGVARAGWREPLGNDQRVHVAADGTVLTYDVGEREFIEITFEWQTDAQKTEWQTFWDYIRTGAQFYFYEDDSYYLADGSETADGDIDASELQTAGATHAEYLVVKDQLELDIAESEVYGYWTVSLRMRKVP